MRGKSIEEANKRKDQIDSYSMTLLNQSESFETTWEEESVSHSGSLYVTLDSALFTFGKKEIVQKEENK